MLILVNHQFVIINLSSINFHLPSKFYQVFSLFGMIVRRLAEVQVVLFRCVNTSECPYINTLFTQEIVIYYEFLLILAVQFQ